MENSNNQISKHNAPSRKERVSDTTLLNLEAAINLIPFAGGFLATYFGEVRGKRSNQRMHTFFQYFSRRLKEIDEQKVDKEYLQSEEFAELFAQGAEQAARSTTQKRIERFANILIHNALLSSKARSRTQSIMSFVDRISDLDAFVILCFGNPALSSIKASTKQEAYELVHKFSNYLRIDCPSFESIIESIVYMDNLGITWVNETALDESVDKGKDLILKEFSCFRTPLGDALARVIAPPGLYRDEMTSNGILKWPEDHVQDVSIE